MHGYKKEGWGHREKTVWMMKDRQTDEDRVGQEMRREKASKLEKRIQSPKWHE